MRLSICSNLGQQLELDKIISLRSKKKLCSSSQFFNCICTVYKRTQGRSTKFWTLYVGILYGLLLATMAIHSSVCVGPLYTQSPFSLQSYAPERTHTANPHRRTKTYKCSQEGKSQKKLPTTTSASALPCLLNQDQFDTCSLHRVTTKEFTQTCADPVSRCLGALDASRGLSHRWLEACRGRWSLLCHPLIRIIKLSQPAAHKWGISPAPPSCRDSLQIASDSPPDCAMIMLSLDAVIMMAHNCWCALAAAQRPPISLSTCLYIHRPPLCL